jgi:DNA-binding GntR family transcriptional regulator
VLVKNVEIKRDEDTKLRPLARSRVLRDQAYDAIKEAIISLNFKPGEKLKETEIANHLGISITPVRGALAQLEQEGLVNNVAFKGTVVAEISEYDIEEIFELRKIIEIYAVRRAAATFSLADLQKAQRILSMLEAAINSNDFESISQYSRAFRQLIIEKTNNKRLISVQRMFDYQLERIKTFITGKENIPIPIKEFRDILRALETGDAEKAESTLLVHLNNLKAELEKAQSMILSMTHILP